MSSGEKLTLSEIIKSVFKKTVSDDLEERRFRIITDDDLQEQIDELKGEEPLPTDETLKIFEFSNVFPAPVRVTINSSKLNLFFNTVSEQVGFIVNEENFATVWENASDYEKLTAFWGLTILSTGVNYDGFTISSTRPAFDGNTGNIVIALSLNYIGTNGQNTTVGNNYDITGGFTVVTIGGGSGGDTPVPVQEDIYYEVQAGDITPTGEPTPAIPVVLSDNFKDIVEDFEKILYINSTIMQAFGQGDGEANMIPSTKWYPYGSDETANDYSIAYQYMSYIQLQWMIVVILHELKSEGETVDNWSILIMPVTYVEQDYVDSNFIHNGDLSIDALYALGKVYLDEISYNYQTYRVEGIKMQDVSVNTNQWVSDNTYAEYPYKATITITTGWPKIDTVMEVVFNVSEAVSGNFAPVCNAYVDNSIGVNYVLKVEIYAKEIPSSTITIPLIKEVL